MEDGPLVSGSEDRGGPVVLQRFLAAKNQGISTHRVHFGARGIRCSRSEQSRNQIAARRTTVLCRHAHLSALATEPRVARTQLRDASMRDDRQRSPAAWQGVDPRTLTGLRSFAATLRGSPAVNHFEAVSK